jgi:hypothetical protein
MVYRGTRKNAFDWWSGDAYTFLRANHGMTSIMVCARKPEKQGLDNE